MALGISTACLYPMLMEDSLETLINLGFHQFEIFINTYSEMEPEFLAMLEKKLRRGGCSRQQNSFCRFLDVQDFLQRQSSKIGRQM